MSTATVASGKKVRLQVNGGKIYSEGTAVGYVKEVDGKKVAFYSNGKFMKDLGPTPKKDDAVNAYAQDTVNLQSAPTPPPATKPIPVATPIFPATAIEQAKGSLFWTHLQSELWAGALFLAAFFFGALIWNKTHQNIWNGSHNFSVPSFPVGEKNPIGEKK